MSLDLRVANEGPLNVTLEWNKVPGCIGYWFYEDGKRVSWTADPNQTTTRFRKPLLGGSKKWAVMAIMPGEGDSLVFPEPELDRTTLATPLLPLRGGAMSPARGVVSWANLQVPMRR